MDSEPAATGDAQAGAEEGVDSRFPQFPGDLDHVGAGGRDAPGTGPASDWTSNRRDCFEALLPTTRALEQLIISSLRR